MTPRGESLDATARDLEKIVGARRVSTSESDRLTYARDMWPRLLLALQAGAPPEHTPNIVVWPESAREVVAIVRLARERRIPIVPYGGGSGVCGGVVPVRGGITIDLKRMTAMSGVDRDEQLCSVEAGLNGERLERGLARLGYTLGHFPSSIYCSTVGGWLATRAAGQMSSKYGKIEDMVAGVSVVTGRGELIETDELARASAGPNWTQLLVGSEGTMGVITSARLRVRLQPELRLLRGFEFPSVAAGVEGIRRLMQRGLRPSVVRLYDELDTFVHSLEGTRNERDIALGDGDAETAALSDPGRQRALAGSPGAGGGALPRIPAAGGARPASGAASIARRWLGDLIHRGAARVGMAGASQPQSSSAGSLRDALMSAALSRPRLFNTVASTVSERIARRGCLMIAGVEGSRIRTEVEARLAFAELERAGGRDLGDGPGNRWLHHRYSVSYNMSRVFAAGAFVDTMEVASTWERLLDLYSSVREAIGRHAAVMAHFSHAYPEGCSIYFSFAARGESLREAQRVYDAIWRDGLAAATRAGGTISHHHGVGLLKGVAMVNEHREAMTVLRALKRTFDPDGIMNPGKLGLAAT